MRLYHNMMSLNTFRNYSKQLTQQSGALNRIASGYKVNSAKDNPNALGQSEMIRMQLRGAQVVQKNLQDGISMMQTVDGGLSTISETLLRMKELAIQSGSGVYTSKEKDAIQIEFSQLRQQIDVTAKSTEFNGINLIDDNPIKGSSLNMSSGANVGESIEVPMYNISSAKLNLSGIDLKKTPNLNNDLKQIDKALNFISDVRSKYGALEQRFDVGIENSSGTEIMLESSESNIRDSDIAFETLQYSKANILVEASTALMAQSNKFPQDILRVLERLK